jgi:DNA replicative helicase MCM subunit Mcm2 (Cdc46/Mcm family)
MDPEDHTGGDDNDDGDYNNATAAQHWTAEKLQRASYKDLGSPTEVEDRFLQHLLSVESCRSALDVLLNSSSSTTRDFSLEIDAFELLLKDTVLGSLLLRFPSTLLPILENAIVRAQKFLQNQRQEEGDNTPTSIKGEKGDSKGNAASRVHARLVHLPPTITRNSVASMKAQDVGKIVQLSGTVVRTSPVQMYESARTYKCCGKNGCSRTFMQHADLEQRSNALSKPDQCPLTIQGGQRCKGTNLQVENDGSVHTDYQEIKIQEAGTYANWDLAMLFFLFPYICSPISSRLNQLLRLVLAISLARS